MTFSVINKKNKKKQTKNKILLREIMQKVQILIKLLW